MRSSCFCHGPRSSKLNFIISYLSISYFIHFQEFYSDNLDTGYFRSAPHPNTRGSFVTESRRWRWASDLLANNDKRASLVLVDGSKERSRNKRFKTKNRSLHTPPLPCQQLSSILVNSRGSGQGEKKGRVTQRKDEVCCLQ